MSSPFSIFRRHQRVLMVITTGLAMISFVLLGAISDPRDMPMPLVVIFLAAMVGGIFWLAGLSRGKATDWGLTGVILGVVLGLAMIWSSRESSAVTLDGGDLTRTKLTELIRQRQVANSFVQMAASVGIPEGGDETVIRTKQMEVNQRIQSNMFGYVGSNDGIREDVVLGEVLRREARKMGIVISDKVVMEFIKDVSAEQLTKDGFAKIRRNLQVSETLLMDILRQEILAREAAKLISSQTFITPQNQWDFYKKLSVTQSAELVSIPVSAFVTDSMKPSADELQNLLNQYRENLPGYTPEGRPDEGRPGFYQLPKMKLAYLEAVFDDIQQTVGEVSDEEIQKRYQEEYLDDVPAEIPAEMKTPGATTLPTPPILPPKSEAPKSEAPKTEEPKTEEPKTEEGTQSLNQRSLERLQFVSLQDEPAKEESGIPAAESEKPANAVPSEPVAEKPVTDPAVPASTPEKEAVPPAPEKPADEKPVVGTPETEKPTSDTPAEEKPAMKAPAVADDGLPPAPVSDVRELDDALKAQIRNDILRERTQKKIVQLMDEANAFVQELARSYRLGEFEEGFVSLEDATLKIKAYAAEKNLEYLETPYLTLNELRESEDFPIGSAFIQSFGDPRGLRSVAEDLAQSIPSILFNVGQARRFNFGELGASESRYIYWKTGFKEAYSPKTIDDEASVRQQVEKVWKQQQADAAAKKRADAIANLLASNDKPTAEALGEETVTGGPESLFLSVRETGDFRMMTQGAAPSTNPFMQQQQGPPRYSIVAGAEDAGQRFFTKVFEELEVGGVGVAPNRDGSLYYVVKIKERNPSSATELEEMQAQFLKQGDQFAYYYMGNNLLSQYGGDWRRELMERYDVQFSAQENAYSSDSEEG